MTNRYLSNRSSLFRFPVLSLLPGSVLNWARQTLIVSLLISLIWLPGLPYSAAIAMPAETISQQADANSIADSRMNALIRCLPKQLSQPSLKRAISEMGNDQLERAFNLKSDPKLSQAEVALASCMSQKKFTN